MKIPFGTDVGLGPGDIVLDRNPAPPPQKKGTAAPTFRPICYGQTAGWIKMPLGKEVGLGPRHIVLDGDPAPPTERNTGASQFSAYVYCGQTVTHFINC